jgi:uncharacterized phage-associated protein
LLPFLKYPENSSEKKSAWQARLSTPMLFHKIAGTCRKRGKAANLCLDFSFMVYYDEIELQKAMKMSIKFNMNSDKALQAILWILHRKPGIDLYNIVKVIFSAEYYHLNKYGRPVYGDDYEAWSFGPVPTFAYKLLGMQSNMPFHRCTRNGFMATGYPNLDMFSETDLEALEFGFKEYGNLPFGKARDKSHKNPAWKKHESDVNAGGKHIAIDYEDMVQNPEVLAELNELGAMTQNMVL